MGADNPVLVRHLVTFCEELLRPSHRIPIMPGEVIRWEDAQAHLTPLMRLFALVTARHDEEPSFSSAAVVVALAALLQDRADEVTQWPSPDHAAVRQATASAIRKAAEVAPGVIGTLNVRVIQTARRIVDLKRFLQSAQPLTIAGFPEHGGIILEAADHRVYWFAELVGAQHSCTRPTMLHPRTVPVTLTTVTDTGDVRFTSECGCVHSALGLEVDRD